MQSFLVIYVYINMAAIVVDFCKKNAEKGQKNPGDLPVGYNNMEKNLVYLGHNVWITNCQYDSIVNVSKTCSIFVKNLAIAVFGTPTLKASSVTGTISNRIKNKRNEKARPQLDPAKMLAIKDTLRHWLSTERGYDEVAIDFEVQQVGTYISQKISELNRKKTAHAGRGVTEGIGSNSQAEGDEIAEFYNVVMDDVSNDVEFEEIQDVHNDGEQDQPENKENINEERDSFSGDISDAMSEIHFEIDGNKTKDVLTNSSKETNAQ